MKDDFQSDNTIISCTCSFCGKSQDEVNKLVAGPNVYICDECIDLCTEIVQDSSDSDQPDGFGVSVPKPKEIYEHLDQYIIGQEYAKKGAVRGGA